MAAFRVEVAHVVVSADGSKDLYRMNVVMMRHDLGLVIDFQNGSFVEGEPCIRAFWSHLGTVEHRVGAGAPI